MARTTAEYTKGTLVRFCHPETADEARERFRVLETRDTRVLVEPVDSGFHIPPTFVYLVEDVMPA